MSLAKFNPKTGVYQSKIGKVAIPEDLSIEEFIFTYDPKSENYKYSSPTPIKRPVSAPNSPWLIDALTGRTLTRRESEERTNAVARALYGQFGLAHDDVLSIFSGNEVDFPISTWAAFQLGSIVSCANPSYSANELSYQLSLVKEYYPIKALLVGIDNLAVAIQALEESKISKSIIVLMAAPTKDTDSQLRSLASQFPTLDDLIAKSTNIKIPAKRAFDPKKKLAFLSFSSGTTGRPKAVEIVHYSLISNVLQMTHHYNETGGMIKRFDVETGTGDKVVAVLPFFHIYGLVCVLHVSIFMGNPVVTLCKFTLPDFLGSIQRHKLSVIYVVPPIIILMCKSPIAVDYDLSSMKVLMSGAAPLSGEVAGLLSKLHPDLRFGQGYGATESCTVITVFDPSDPNKIETAAAGVLVPNLECKIVSPEGKNLPWEERGELWSRSPSNASGYLGNIQATKDTWDSEGYFHTGDEAYMSKSGWIYITDRIKELIKVSGNQVAPAELEGHLLASPEVADAAVIGIPHDFTGEVAKAFVVLSPSALAKVQADPSAEKSIIESIKKHVSDHKIKYKWLGEVQILEIIPKTASGKLLRKDLRVLHATQANAKKEKL